MGMVPMNTRVVRRANTGPALVPPGFGQQPNVAAARQGAVVADLLGQTAALVGEHALKHKRQDMEADGAAFDAFMKRRMTDARESSALTVDPDAVTRIYGDAEADLLKYLNGKNPGGTPNVRWRDHKEHLLNNFEGMKAGLYREQTERKLSIYRADTAAKLQTQIQVGIETGDYGAIVRGNDLLAADGHQTQAQAAENKRLGRRAADTYRAGQIVRDIEQSSPAEAEAKFAGFDTAINDPEQYKYLDDAGRKDMASRGKKALWASQAAADRARREASSASADTVLDFEYENGRLPTETEAESLQLTKEHLVQIRKANLPIKQRAAAETAADELSVQIGNYERGQDEDGKERLEISLALSRLPSEFKTPLSKLWKLKTTPGKAAQAEGLQRVQNFVATDWKWGYGGQLKGEELSSIKALETDAFERWIETENPSDDQILSYTVDNPRYQAVRSNKSFENFRKSLNVPEIKTTPKLRGAQGVYLSDEELNAFEGL